MDVEKEEIKRKRKPRWVARKHKKNNKGIIWKSSSRRKVRYQGERMTMGRKRTRLRRWKIKVEIGVGLVES